MGHSAQMKEVRKLINAALKAGWRVEPSTDGWKFWPPDKERTRPLVVHGTSRGIRSDYHNLRKAGLDI